MPMTKEQKKALYGKAITTGERKTEFFAESKKTDT